MGEALAVKKNPIVPPEGVLTFLKLKTPVGKDVCRGHQMPQSSDERKCQPLEGD